MNEITARDIMTTPAISVKPHTMLSQVNKTMELHKISGVPVVGDDDKVVGIISEKDLLKYTHWVIGHPTRNPGKLLGSKNEVTFASGERGIDMIEAVASASAGMVMTENVITVEEDTPVLKIVHLMNKWDINRIPVLDKAGKLKGIVSRANILQMVEHWANNK